MEFRLSLLLIGFLVGSIATLDLEAEDDECPRYSVDEFKASVFDPIYKHEIDRLKYALDTAIDNVDGILELLEENGHTLKGGEIKSVREVLDRTRKNGDLLFPTFYELQEKVWEPLVKPEEPITALMETRLLYQNVHMAIHRVHYEVDEPFTDLAITAKSLLHPIVKLLTKVLGMENGLTKRDEMFENLKKKKKFMGIVVGNLVAAELDEEPIEDADFVYNLNEFWSKYTSMLYWQGLAPHDEEGKKIVKHPPLTMAEFYKLAMETYWGWSGDKNCVGEPGQECNDNHMVSLMTSLIYNTDIESDDWLPTIEELDKYKQKLHEEWSRYPTYSGRMKEKLQ